MKRLSLITSALLAVTACSDVSTNSEPNTITADYPNNYFANELIQFTQNNAFPNSAWCWFQDERIVIDSNHPDGPMLLFTGISASANNEAEQGDLDLYWYNITSKQKGAVELHDQLGQDDHNMASLFINDGGQYLAMYSAHGVDKYTHHRLSEPHDPTKWSAPEKIENLGNPTYNNIVDIRSQGQQTLYNFTRSLNAQPNFMTSTDGGKNWQLGAQLLAAKPGPHVKFSSPYVKYVGKGSDKLHFFATEQHPRNYDNSIYHGVFNGNTITNSHGEVIDDNVFDEKSPYSQQLTQIFQGDANHVAWTNDVELDKNDLPYVGFSVQKDGANKTRGDGGFDHRYYYGRFDGQKWFTQEIAYAGTRLYAMEDDYTGLIALDPHNPYQVVISTDAHPETGEALISNSDGKRHYEIYLGNSADQGDTWQWQPLTQHSSEDNIRPEIPHWQAEQLAVVWMKGTYTDYEHWDTKMVGMIINR